MPVLFPIPMFSPIRNFFYKIVQWCYKGPCQEILVIFIGSQKSGKSTTIKHIFHEAPYDHSQDQNHTSALGLEMSTIDKKNRILEVRGLAGSSARQINAEIFARLEQYAKEKPYVPTVVVITASLTDNRFVGPGSEFSLMLQSIRILENILLEKNSSNIIMVLTNSSNPSVQSVRAQKIDSYIEAFKTVFLKEPLCCIPGETQHLPSYHDNTSETDLNIAEKTLSSEVKGQLGIFHWQFLDFVKDSQKYKWQQEIKHYYDIQASSMLNKLEGLNNGVPLEPCHFDIDHGERYEFPSCLHAELFGEYRSLKNLNNSSGNAVYHLIEPGSRVLLDDKTELLISECVLGQRVYCIGNRSGVITNLVKIFGNQFCAGGKFSFGKVYKVGSTSEDKYLFYEYKNGSIGFSRKDPPQLKVHKGVLVYFYVEVNGGVDPFIVDGLVCYSKKSFGDP